MRKAYSTLVRPTHEGNLLRIRIHTAPGLNSELWKGCWRPHSSGVDREVTETVYRRRRVTFLRVLVVACSDSAAAHGPRTLHVIRCRLVQWRIMEATVLFHVIAHHTADITSTCSQKIKKNVQIGLAVGSADCTLRAPIGSIWDLLTLLDWKFNYNK